MNLNTFYNKKIIKISKDYFNVHGKFQFKIIELKHTILRLMTSCDICLGVKLADDIVIPHAVGIVIGGTASIGSRTVIMPNVVIGAADYPSEDVQRHATIGKNVLIGAGTIILGNITIGDSCVIGETVRKLDII